MVTPSVIPSAVARPESDEDREAAVEEAAEHVAAEVVRPEPRVARRGRERE